ncbi:metal-sulfur cluster biosynthetic enzyme [Silvimonas terrae]|uniref:Metal-sulfur cluster biosynthetic enzyme n=1 Tax=Silvimonas terrae TaxID=300266 RepID=A0A840RGM2_9NEIS|nr:metal-sulfur cluster assembly factor [Silvimonas terrae]MBB5192759.1 metal-sulfur cluster biosynthetic enzyme [Silvimonas terrae]
MSSITVDAVRDALKTVIDPEIGINIVDLGLVYHVDITPDTIKVMMTMTTPACPMGNMLQEDVHDTLGAHFGTTRAVEIELVWEPLWSPERMSESARSHFGWDG